jgi:diguanylate cyclase (GGDEF)-like protein
MESRHGTRPRLAVPVWTLLVALTLVPTLGMGFFAARQAAVGATAAERAAQVEDDTRQLVAVMELVFALIQETVPSQATVTAGQYGLSTGQASAMLGFDVAERLDRTRRATDAVLAPLPPSVLERGALVGLPDRLAAARALADDHSNPPEPVQQAFMDLVNDANASSAVLLDALTAPGRPVPAAEVDVALRSFNAVVATFRAASTELEAASHSLFHPHDPSVAARLLLANDAFTREATLLDGHRQPEVAAAWAELRASPEAERMDEVVGAIVADPGYFAAPDVAAAAEIFTTGLARSDGFTELVRIAGQGAVDAARGAGDAARDAHREAILVGVGVGVLAVYLAFMLAWSISQPLHRLARRARAVSLGRFPEDGFGETGPLEVRVVGRALDEATANLRRVGTQARALADGELDADVLALPAAGPLGESLHASVEQLSRSIRAQEELRERLAEQASHDPLTGLLNRSGCLTAADQALARARRTGQQIALLFLDLDDFKRANDNHGHALGDAVLCTTAGRLVEAARAGDTVARLGGDEFVVIAEPVTDIEQAVALGQRLIDAVSEPVEIDGRIARVGASVGVAVNQDAHEAGDELLRDADQAVYRAKRAGRGRVEVFNESLRRELAERADIEDALRTGMARGELELHYQPVVDAVTGDLQGFEALARWDRPGYGPVPPSVFVPVAEGCELVVELGRWVLHEATHQMVSWSDDPAVHPGHISVNISGRHLLHNGIVDDVRGALAASGLEPGRLVLEITETVILSDMDVVLSHLQELRNLGVRVALDDFGTGYTSIGQLGQLPIDILKIDRLFVSTIEHGSDRSIVELMVEVAHTLGLGLVAEGVEDGGQLQALRNLSCDDVQGYLIAKPLPPGEVRDWMVRAQDDPASRPAMQGLR